MNKVCFVILCWNNQDLLQECLESIAAQTYKNHRTIVVDNGSSDGSVAYLKKNYPEVAIVETGQNLGFAKGNNIGIREALKDEAVKYLALVNTDARLDKDWLKRIVEFAAQKPKAASLQGTTLDYYDHNVIDSTHIYIAKNGQATQAGYRTDYNYELGPKKVFGVNAAAAVFSRDFIEAQPFKDFFDETMFMYLEDVDVAARATIMGWDSYLIPGALAYHMGSKSSGKNPNYSLFMTYRNNLGTTIKNLPLPLLIKIFPRSVRADWHMFLNLRKLGKKDASWKVYQGRAAGVLYLPIFLIKRWRLAYYRKIDPHYLWFLMYRGY